MVERMKRVAIAVGAGLRAYFNDLLGASGLLLLGYGLYLRAPWVAFAAVGAILFGVALLAAWKGGR